MDDNTIKIFISGDFAPRLRVNEAIEKSEYAQLFGDILPVIKEADYSITNLESPLIEKGTPIAKTGPNLKAPVKSIEALKFVEFDMVTLANNHIMDYGDEGLFSTIEICKKNNINVVGVGKNLKEAQQIKYVTIKGKTISFINIAENEWSTTDGERPGANPLNEVYAYYQIQEAKKNSDYLILIIHGGHETYELPSPRMKRLYRWFIDLGADAVIGNHTHCFSGNEVYKNKPIVYSLGNFIFDGKSRNTSWNIGVACILELEKTEFELKLFPYYQCDEKIGITLFTQTQQIEFEKLRQKKEQIILSDQKLNEFYQSFINSNKKMYLSYLEPIKNKWILRCINRGFIPGFIRNNYKRLLLNLIRDEAHRDIVMSILSE